MAPKDNVLISVLFGLQEKRILAGDWLSTELTRPIRRSGIETLRTPPISEGAGRSGRASGEGTEVNAPAAAVPSVARA
jgi:hypothetical protein